MSANHLYEPGDMVTVRRDLNENDLYPMLVGSRTNFAVHASAKQIAVAGQQFEVAWYSNSNKTLQLKGFGGNWTEAMFEHPDWYRPPEQVCFRSLL